MNRKKKKRKKYKRGSEIGLVENVVNPVMCTHNIIMHALPPIFRYAFQQ